MCFLATMLGIDKIINHSRIKGARSVECDQSDKVAELFGGHFDQQLPHAAAFKLEYTEGITIAGFPAYESWDGDWPRATVAVVVAKRFIVQATGSGVDNADAVRALVTAVNFSSLAAIK